MSDFQDYSYWGLNSAEIAKARARWCVESRRNGGTWDGPYRVIVPRPCNFDYVLQKRAPPLMSERFTTRTVMRWRYDR